MKKDEKALIISLIIRCGLGETKDHSYPILV